MAHLQQVSHDVASTIDYRQAPGMTVTRDSAAAISRAAAAFADAVAAGRAVRVEGGSVLQHLQVLHELVATQPINVCKRYASLPEIPLGRFSALDAFRSLILRAPDSTPDDIGDFPLRMPEADYIAFPSRGASVMLFVFTGAAHQFGGPIRVVHQWFRRLGVSVVYLFDMDWTYYLGGIRGLAGTIEGSAEALKTMARAAGATTHLCVGNSGGGFGALLYAMHLAARRTLAFSPPTAIRESLEIVTRKVPHARGLVTGSGAIDLRAIHESIREPRACRIYFPEQNAHDRDEALNLAGLPGIDVQPVPGLKTHNLIPSFVDTGRFEQELNWLVQS